MKLTPRPSNLAAEVASSRSDRTPRKTYSAPQLVVWGCMDDLTRGSGGPATDSPFPGYRFAE